MESLAIGEEMVAREIPPISYGPGELASIIFPHSDALIIGATIANYDVVRVLVDSASSVNVLF